MFNLLIDLFICLYIFATPVVVHFPEIFALNCVKFHEGNVFNFRIHMSHLPAKDISIFKSLLVYFSIGGSHYNHEPLVYEGHAESYKADSSFYLNIPLTGRCARSLKLHLHFRLKWMMISEVRFVSGDYPRSWQSLSPYSSCCYRISIGVFF